MEPAGHPTDLAAMLTDTRRKWTARPGDQMGQRKYSIMILSSGGGGIRSVVDGYERDGFCSRWNVRLLFSHATGSVVRRLVTATGAIVEFASLLALGRVALVHCHVAMWGSFWRKSLFAELARLFRVPVVLHLHGSELRLFVERQGPLGRRLIARQLRLANRVLVLSDSWKGFVEHVSAEARTTVLPNYVPLASRPVSHGPCRAVRVIFLGLLGPRKGVFDLLRGFKDASTRAGDMTLLLAGNGDVDAVRRLVRTLGLQDSVQLPGWVAGAEKERLLESADILVLPSYNEGLPMSILEAMSLGIAIVASRVGAIPETIKDGEEGMLIDAGDVRGLATCLETLARDHGLRARLGRAARARVETEFVPGVVLPILDAVYEELVT